MRFLFLDSRTNENSCTSTSEGTPDILKWWKAKASHPLPRSLCGSPDYLRACAWYSPSFAQFMLLVTLIWRWAKGLVPGRSKDQTVLRMTELFFSNSGCCFTLPLYGEVHHLENELCLQFQWGQLLWMGALYFSHLYLKKQGGTERDMKGSWPDCPSYPPQPAGWSQSSVVFLSFSQLIRIREVLSATDTPSFSRGQP